MSHSTTVSGETKDAVRRDTIDRLIDEADSMYVYTEATCVEVVPRKGATAKEFAATGEQTLFIKLYKDKRFVEEGDERINDEG